MVCEKHRKVLRIFLPLSLNHPAGVWIFAKGSLLLKLWGPQGSSWLFLLFFAFSFSEPWEEGRKTRQSPGCQASARCCDSQHGESVRGKLKCVKEEEGKIQPAELGGRNWFQTPGSRSGGKGKYVLYEEWGSKRCVEKHGEKENKLVASEQRRKHDLWRVMD